MTIRIEVGGVQYDSFVAAAAEIRLDSLANVFSFEATAKDARPLPFFGGEFCEVFVDGDRVLTGSIEKVATAYDRESHSIAIQGRDKPADLLDSSLDIVDDLRPPISLKTILERVIESINADLKVVDLANPDKFNAAEDLAAPEPGDNAFDFCEKMARKRQVLLTSNSDGDVVIVRGSGTRVDAFLINRLNDRSNNVMSGASDYDLTDRFTRYKVAGQLNLIATALAGDTPISSIVEQGANAVVTDDFGLTPPRRGRQMVIVSESPFSDEQALERVQWEANIRRARSRVYSVVVDGFRNQTGALWGINELVRVDDVDAGINSVMLVNSVIFGLTEDAGSTSTLSLVERDAYELEASEPDNDETGVGLAFG